MSNSRSKHYNNRTLYVTSGVAREEQLHRSLRTAIKEGEENMYKERLTQFLTGNKVDLDIDTTLSVNEQNKFVVDKLTELGFTDYPNKTDLECSIRVNLIVNKNGNYYGFGYVHVSREDVYWMLLGKNPDGSDRCLEYPDPDWKPPSPKPVMTEDEEMKRYSSMTWYEIAEEEDKYVQPIIKEVLPPLMSMPGYTYDSIQYRHLQDIAVKEEKDPNNVPKMGYFELSRAYARDVDSGKMSNVLCARQVPEWIPAKAFKNIFQDYASDNTTKHSIGDPENNIHDTYPMINLIDAKKEGGNVVFITFQPNTRDAIFALLMTRKVHIVHPNNNKLECTLIFDHAYEQGKSRNGHKESKTRDRQRYQPISRSGDRSGDRQRYQPDSRSGDRQRYQSDSRPGDRQRYQPSGRGSSEDRSGDRSGDRQRYQSGDKDRGRGRGRGRGSGNRSNRSGTKPTGRDDADINMLSKYNYTARK